MTSLEQDIHNLDSEAIKTKLCSITSDKDLTPIIIQKISILAEQFVELEKNNWNGIWARIVTNFLTTANLGKFDLIVGNPPWIDWKNLPAGYRERVKSICVDRNLFSGDSITGGINLNICALISNVAALNWLQTNGILAFLMPQSIIFQKTYEGFRKFHLNENENLYIQKIYDWTLAGHPFAPVTHKFLTYFFSNKKIDYSNGIPVKHFIKNKGYDLTKYSDATNFNLLESVFSISYKVAGQASNDTVFSYAENKRELELFKKISGDSCYKGREGIEFYPQELFLLEVDNEIHSTSEIVIVKNFQNRKSKYKIPLESFPLEKNIYIL